MLFGLVPKHARQIVTAQCSAVHLGIAALRMFAMVEKWWVTFARRIKNVKVRYVPIIHHKKMKTISRAPMRQGIWEYSLRMAL